MRLVYSLGCHSGASASISTGIRSLRRADSGEGWRPKILWKFAEIAPKVEGPERAEFPLSD